MDDRNYHERRAQQQRGLAERSVDPVVASTHRALAELHEERVKRLGGRPVLRMVMPTH